VTVHDCAQRPNGQWFIVLQFVEGGSLKRKMQTVGGPLALGDVVSIAARPRARLHAAHEHEIIHRDIKPENILLTQSPINPTDDQVTIVDFGIAKLSKARGGSGTRAGTIAGDAELHGARVPAGRTRSITASTSTRSGWSRGRC
jgi:serine/threonine protein kinase